MANAGWQDRSGPAPTILIVGPSPEQIGGVAAVVKQMVGLRFAGLYRTELFTTTASGGSHERLTGRLRRHRRHLHALGQVVRRLRPAVVHIHTCSGFSFYRSVMDMLVVRHLGVKVVLHVHGAAFDSFHARAKVWSRYFISWSLSRADCVIALSESWGCVLQRIAVAARMAVVENAVPAVEEVMPRPPAGPCRFLLLARMDDWKGIDDLFSACHTLRGEGVAFELVLAGPPGSAGSAAELNEKIRRLGLAERVHLAGPVRGEAKDRLLRWADVYVQPSHHEGLPIAMLEGLAYQLPIVATRVGAVPEVLGEKPPGLLVPSRDPHRLAGAMRDLAEAPDRRADLSRAAGRLATTRFSMKRFENDLIRLYDGLLSCPGDSPAVLPLPAATGSVAT